VLHTFDVNAFALCHERCLLRSIGSCLIARCRMTVYGFGGSALFADVS
jgi:hypothetical protein